MGNRWWRGPRERALAALVAVGLALGMASGSVPAVGAQVDNETQLRALAEALLLQPYGGYGSPPAPGSQLAVELLPGQQPQELDFALPVPPQGHLLGTAVRRTDGRVVSAEIVTEAPLGPEALRDYYERALQDLGWWSPMLQATTRSGGFQPAPTLTTGLLFCAPDDRQYLNLTVIAKNPAASLARATITQPEAVSPPSGIVAVPPAPCSASRISPQPVASATVQLPAVTAPAGMRMLTFGMGPSGPPGSPGSQSATSTAVAVGPQAPAELEAYFAQQLAAAGWTRRGGQAEPTLAWSRWQAPDPPGTQGFLLVLATPGQNQCFLLLRADPPPGANDAGVQPGTRWQYPSPVPPAPAPPPPPSAP